MMRGDVPASAITYVRNGGPAFEKCLQSCLFCKEHVVLDGGSTDGTRELALRYGCRVLPQDPRFLDQEGHIVNFGGIATQAYAATTQEWVVFIAADEELDGELIRGIIDVIRAGRKGVYFFNRYFLLNGRVIRYASMIPDRQIRFCHREAVLGFKKVVHERPVLAPGITPQLLPQGCQYIPLNVTPAILKAKYRRYLDLEKQSFASFGWFRWMRYAIRRFLVIGVLVLRMIRIRLLHFPFHCLPLRYDLLNVWYNWQLVKRSCPLVRSICTHTR